MAAPSFITAGAARAPAPLLVAVASARGKNPEPSSRRRQPPRDAARLTESKRHEEPALGSAPPPAAHRGGLCGHYRGEKGRLSEQGAVLDATRLAFARGAQEPSAGCGRDESACVALCPASAFGGKFGTGREALAAAWAGAGLG